MLYEAVFEKNEKYELFRKRGCAILLDIEGESLVSNNPFNFLCV